MYPYTRFLPVKMYKIKKIMQHYDTLMLMLILNIMKLRINIIMREKKMLKKSGCCSRTGHWYRWEVGKVGYHIV